MVSEERKPIMEVWGQSPPVGSRGRAPDQGVRRVKVPEGESFLRIEPPKDEAHCDTK